MRVLIELPETLQRIVRELSSLSYNAFLVGGAVLDALMGKPIKDWDVECYGLNYEQLNEILKQYGKTSLVGRAFGIIKLWSRGVEYDFSIPRKDNKTGIGHTGFAVELDPLLDVKEAARRRDLTINAIYLNLATLEIVDPFNGLEDLKKGRLKATDPATFIEDPLRVLRIMQILPRKGKFVDTATIELCRSMIDEFESLPSERLLQEFNKLLMKTDKPSAGLKFLIDCGWIVKFPELEAMIGTPQNPEHHPEGDVWTHSLLVLDNAAKLRNKLPEDWQLPFMYGMLCHDMGKPVTTDPIRLTAYKHEAEGVAKALNFMHRLTNNIELTEKVLSIVKNHMRPYQLATERVSPGAWKRLHNELPLHIAAFVTQADKCGNFTDDVLKMKPETETILSKSNELGRQKITPILKGEHLIKKGHKPGPEFKRILSAAFDIQLDEGIEDADTLYSRVMNSLRGSL